MSNELAGLLDPTAAMAEAESISFNEHLALVCKVVVGTLCSKIARQYYLVTMLVPRFDMIDKKCNWWASREDPHQQS